MDDGIDDEKNGPPLSWRAPRLRGSHPFGCRVDDAHRAGQEDVDDHGVVSIGGNPTHPRSAGTDRDLVLGGVYFGGTVLRLVLGLTVRTNSPFFAKPVPIFFHLVLASFLLVCGYYHTQGEPMSASSER